MNNTHVNQGRFNKNTTFLVISCCYWSQVLNPCLTTVYQKVASGNSFLLCLVLTSIHHSLCHWNCIQHLTVWMQNCLTHWLQLCLHAFWSLPSHPLYKCAPLTLIVVGLLSQAHSLCLKSLCILTYSAYFLLSFYFLNVFYNMIHSTPCTFYTIP